MLAAAHLPIPQPAGPAVQAAPPNHQPLNGKISEFTKRVFTELSISLGLNLLIIAFTATPLSIPVLTIIAATTLVGVTVRMIFESQFDDNADEFDAMLPPFGEVVARLGIVNAIGQSSLNILIHEAGHALTALACFVNPGIKIKWDFFVHGETSFSVSNGMTKLGNYLGKNNSIMLFRAGGLIASTVLAMTEVAIAFFVKDSSPQASLTLKCHAFSQISNDLLYGLSALLSNGFNVRNDYLALWKIGGIHPLIPMTLMVALPVILYVGLQLLSSASAVT